MAVVFTNSGHSAVVTRVIGSGTQCNYVEWGTGAGTTVSTDNTISGAVNARVAGAVAAYTTTLTNDTYQVVGTLTASAAYAITNAGIFDAASNGNCYVKGDFGALNLASGDSVQFTFRLQFS
jgi:hypothetical protein